MQELEQRCGQCIRKGWLARAASRRADVGQLRRDLPQAFVAGNRRVEPQGKRDQAAQCLSRSKGVCASLADAEKDFKRLTVRIARQRDKGCAERGRHAGRLARQDVRACCDGWIGRVHGWSLSSSPARRQQ